MRIQTVFAAVLLLAAVPFVGAAEFKKPAEDAKNPAPTVALNTYQRFEMSPIAMDAPYAGQKGNEVAREYLQANLDERVGAVLKAWNEKPAGDAPLTLKIEPKMTHVRFISGGKRFFAGGFAGKSWVYVTAKLTDAQTGAVVGEPGFYQQASALGAAWTFGTTDKTMLIRISNMVTEYLRSNYPQAIGGAISQAPDISN